MKHNFICVIEEKLEIFLSTLDLKRPLLLLNLLYCVCFEVQYLLVFRLN